MSSTASSVLMLVGTVLFAILAIKLITKPIRMLFKFLIHAAFGYLLLWLVNFLGAYVGVHIEPSLINTLIAGIGGIPGVVLLVLAKFIF